MSSSPAPSLPASPHWSAVEQAWRREQPRVPFTIDGIAVGSVALGHLPALAACGRALRVGGQGVALAVPPAQRDAALAEINAGLREQGLIRAWRDETYALVDPATLQELARLERAASRFWGTLTVGAHCNGYVAGADGRAQQLWVAQRAFDKATDPGMFDNLVGGGVPAGQTPRETLLREGWEEAGLGLALLERATPGRVLKLDRDIPEGLQFERIHVFDLELPAGVSPANQDGEVAGFRLLGVAEALALAAGTTMTVDASLVTLDFALRRGLLDDAGVAARAARLWLQAAP